nr:PREDICTED: BCL2/adenovirus E1B 19 kDa protein-interacting protein 3 isoform X1 [Bos indicus]
MNRLQVSPVSRLLRSHRGVFPYWLHWSEESAVSRAASSPVLGWQTQLLSHWQRRVPAHGLKGLLLGFVYSIKRRLHGSWVELHFGSNGNGSSVPDSVSIYNGDMEKILLDAQHESGRSSSKSSHCDSPPRSQTPQDTNRASETDTHSLGEKNSSQSEEDYMERRKEVESILKKNSDWIWDWSSRPENVPPAKEFLLFKHPKRTPTLSMRNTSVMKKGGIFSAEFLKVFLPSLLLSHLLAIGLGIYIGRRLTTSTSTF